MSKHTPGPWECTNHIDEEHFADIESTNGPLYIRASWGSTYDRITKSQHALRDAEMMANARLIAAAPDLLVALETALSVIKDYLEYEHNGDPWVEDARAMGEMDIDDYQRDGKLAAALAVVAKAKGEQNG